MNVADTADQLVLDEIKQRMKEAKPPVKPPIDFRTPHPEPQRKRKTLAPRKPKPANDEDLRKLVEHFNTRRS